MDRVLVTSSRQLGGFLSIDMCGIVGLFLKDVTLEPELGALLAGMLGTMCDRGPDSAGFAVYRGATPGTIKLTIRAPQDFDVAATVHRLKASGIAVSHAVHDTHFVLTVPVAQEAAARAEIAAVPELTLVGSGRRMEIFKEVGRPDIVAKRFGLGAMTGTHAVGHTRMATESAVTTDGAHPFTTGADQCLVHNGSLSNPHLVRKKLEPLGITFETDNDTEAACRFFEWRLREGDDLKTAVTRGFSELDGFYTFLMGTDRELLIVRDAFACKPAVVAETDDYVAIASEFRSLAHLPHIAHASLFEPKPEEIYSWRI